MIFPQKDQRNVQFPGNKGFRLYFLKGCDDKLLQKSQQKEVLNYVKRNPLGHSFMIYNSDDLKNKINEWSQALPWITPYYAVKSNPIHEILQDITYGRYGTFDCASKGEMKQVMSYGIPGSKVVYSNPVKEEKDIQYAKKQGVELTTADSIDELIKIRNIAPEMKILWRISIVEASPEKMASTFSGKFGDDLPNIEAAHQRFEQIQKLGISLYGINFHCGSGRNGSLSFGKAIDFTQECMKIGRQYGHKMEILDVGGGFPTGSLDQDIIKTLEKTRNNELGYQVIAEPGRYFSANACTLFFRIMAKKIKHGKLCYHVNESLFHSFNCVLMDGVSFENSTDQCYDVINSDQQVNSKINSQENVSIFGMTCDGADIIAKNVLLPNDMEVGDWLCMGGMGAYTNGAKSSFNGMKSTTKVYNYMKQNDQHQNCLQ